MLIKFFKSMMKKPADKAVILVVAGDFEENSGGSIALYSLVHILRKLGQEAYIYPFYWLDIPNEERELREIDDPKEEGLEYYESLRRVTTCAYMECPVWDRLSVGEAVVVYPEIIAGNPIRANKVVRWFLHRPGFHTNVIDYGPGELYFYYKKTFNDEELNPNSSNHLEVVKVFHEIYSDAIDSTRDIDCCILRKGADRAINVNLDNVTCVDGMSHQETALVFKRSKRCYCYDLDTMYARYAALCGCEVIVIPEDGLILEQWRPDEARRYGLAYGDSDEQLAWARLTRSKLYDDMCRIENRSEQSVQFFLEKVALFFKVRTN